jgi:hypothetical protein
MHAGEINTAQESEDIQRDPAGSTPVIADRKTKSGTGERDHRRGWA